MFVSPIFPLSYPLKDIKRGLLPSSIFYTGPGDYESLVHTLSGFLTEVPPAITAVQRAWIVEDVEKLSVVHTLHLAWDVFTPFR